MFLDLSEEIPFAHSLCKLLSFKTDNHLVAMSGRFIFAIENPSCTSYFLLFSQLDFLLFNFRIHRSKLFLILDLDLFPTLKNLGV